jgi:monoamine oxidase
MAALSGASIIATPSRKRVAVVGAGLAGLNAADRLLQSTSAEVVVVESSARVGGRNGSCFLQSFPSTACDIGGQWVGAKHEPVKGLARELGIPLLPQFNTGRRVVQMGSNIRSYSGLIPNLSWGVLIDTQLAITWIKILQFFVWLFPLTCCLQRRLDRTTMEQMKNRVMWTQGGRALLTIIIRAFLGLEPSQVSVLSFAREINASDSIERMSETGPGNLQMATLSGGAQQLSARLAGRILSRGGQILFEHRVVNVSKGTQPSSSAPATTTGDSSSISSSKPVLIRCENGVTLEADHVIICCPAPIVTKHVTFTPSLSPHRSTLMHRTAMGSIIKSIIVYPRAFWRETGYSGEVICDVDTDPNHGPVFNLFDGSAPIGSKPIAPPASSPSAVTLPEDKRMASPSSHYLDPAVQEWITAGRPRPADAAEGGGEDLGFPDVRFIIGKHPVTGAEGSKFVPTLVAFINGQMASEQSKRVSFDDRRAAVCRQIGAWFGAPEEAMRPLEYIEQDWVAYPHSLGCPVALANGAGVIEAFGTHRHLADPEWPEVLANGGNKTLHRLHFAGTETSEISTGFMCGAIRSGHRAAAEVAADILVEEQAGPGVAAHYSHSPASAASATIEASASSGVTVVSVVSKQQAAATTTDLASPLLLAEASSLSS